MISHVALLRGINVGGHALVAMADLRALLESMKFSEVKTLLQSGNVVFKGRPSVNLEAQLEKAILQMAGRPIDCMVCTGTEWETVIEANPFGKEAKDDPSHMLVMRLKDAPDAKALVALKAAIVGPEYFQAKGKNLYLVYPEGIGRSKLTNLLIEKKLGTRGTARNWNTVLKIAAILESPQPTPSP